MIYIVLSTLLVCCLLFYFGNRYSVIMGEEGTGISRGISKPRKQDLDLSQPTKLKFYKDSYGSYEIGFLNPLTNEYWILPEVNAGIHALWDFDRFGSYSAYGIYKESVDYDDIEKAKKRFATLKDIDDHFKKCREAYYSWKKSEEKEAKRPNVISN